MACELGSCDDTQSLREDFPLHLFIWPSLYNTLEKWGKSVLSNTENIDKLSLPVVSNTVELMAPFYFNYEGWWWYGDIQSELMKMLVGFGGVYGTLKRKTGLVIEKDDGWFVSIVYQPPVDTTQWMYSVLPHDLDAAGQKYKDMDNMVKSLNATFWMSLGKCHQIRIQASMLLLIFSHYWI